MLLTLSSACTITVQAQDRGLTLYQTYTTNYRSTYYDSPGTFMYQYSDYLFSEDATNLGEEYLGYLAKASVAMAAAAYNGEHVKSSLKNMGYTIITQENYSSDGTKTTATEDNNDVIGYTIAKKDCYDIALSEKMYSVYAIIIRGTNTYEWISNFNVGKDSTHKGFTLAMEKLYLSLSTNLSGINRNNDKIWIAGHSRGAAVSNLLGQKLTETKKYALPKNIFTFTYACPNTVIGNEVQYTNIHNFNNATDFVCSMPLYNWGYNRYGITTNLAENDELFPNVRLKFQALTVDETGSLSSGKLYSGLTKESLGGIISGMNSLAPSVEKYYEEYTYDGNKTNSPYHVFDTLGHVMAKKVSFSTIEAVSIVADRNDPASDVILEIIKNVNGVTDSHSPEFYLAWMDVLYNRVNYTVNHYLMNTDGSTYTLKNQETFNAWANTEVTPDTKEYTGFTAPSKEKIKVYYHGHSKVDYYYTRNQYKVTLSNDDGIKNISQSSTGGTYYYGEDVNVSASIYNYYKFDKWISSNSSLLPNSTTGSYKFTMPAGNVSLRASSIKTIDDELYKVTYYVDGKKYDSQMYCQGEKIPSHSIPSKTGYTFFGWNGNPETMPNHNVNITGSFKVNSHNVSYFVDGSLYHTDTYDYDSQINPIAEPTKNGYTFTGWSTIPKTMPDKNVIVNGEFNINNNNELPAYYQVTADSLAMRTSASQGSDAVGYLSKGTIVKVTKITDNWAYYTYNGKSAYSSMEYLQFVGLAGDSSKITPGSTVTVNSEANWYEGNSIPDWVYGVNLVVKSISGDKAVVTNNGSVIGTVNVKDLTLVTDNISSEDAEGNYISNSYGIGKVVAKGINVSEAQGNIDWNKVAASGVDYVILRVGCGSTKDSKFETYYSGAKAAGLDVGVYFDTEATSNQTAYNEAKNVFSWIDSKVLKYPVYYSLGKANQDERLKTANTNMCQIFCSYIKNKGYLSGVYADSNHMNKYLDMSALRPNCETWIVNHYDNTDTDRWGYSTNYGMWQYTSKGAANGITGRIDRNVCFKNYPAVSQKYSLGGTSEDSTTVTTSKDFRIYKTDKQFESSPAYSDYPAFADMYIENATNPKLCIPVAGLECTNVSGTACKTMVPQGICFAGDYMLVTAHDSEGVANSVIYIYSDETRELLSVAVLPSKSHLGGIAYDYDRSGNIWVCNGTDGVMSIKYSLIDSIASSGKAYVTLTSSNVTKHSLAGAVTGSTANGSVTTKFSASYCCFDSETSMLWVGEFVPISASQIKSGVTSDTGNMYGYTVSGITTSPTLTQLNRIQVPDRIQGASIRTVDGTKYLALSRSYCRKTAVSNYISQIRIYTPSWDSPTSSGFIYKNDSVKNITMPPMLEGIYLSGSYLYTLFESAATRYYTGNDGSGVCPAPVDRICGLKLSQVLNNEQHSISYIADGNVVNTNTGATGTVVTIPNVPAKIGYTGKWDTVYKTIQSTDSTVNAVYTPIKYKINYYDNGVLVNSQMMTYNQTYKLLSADSLGIKKDGYSFNGWKLSENSSDVTYGDKQSVSNLTYIDGNTISLYSSEELNTYYVKYYVDGKIYKTQSYKYGEEIFPLAEPTKIGYTFSGWSEIPSSMPGNSIEVNGTFTASTYNIKYYVDGEEYQTQSYKYGEEISPIAEPTKTGYTFSGWSEIPTTMPANDVEVNGTFTKIDKPVIKHYATLQASVINGTGLKVKIGDGREKNQPIFYKNTKAEIGQNITLTAKSSANSKFMYWVDNHDTIISQNEVYTFVLTGNVNVTAVYEYKEESYNSVTFIGAYSQILSSVLCNTESQIEIPEVTQRTGYDFAGWSLDGKTVIADENLEKAIIEQIALGNDVTVTSMYKAKDTVYTVTVENGTGTGEYTASSIVTVTANKAESGKKFAYWTKNGKIVSYDESYSFYVNENSLCTAVYVAETEDVDVKALSVIDQVTYDNTSQKMTFVSVSSVPENCRILYTGVILTSSEKTGKDSEAFVKDASGVIGSNMQVAEGSYTARYSLTKKNVAESDTWYSRSYVIYYDANGVLQTTYSDIVCATVTGGKAVYKAI